MGFLSSLVGGFTGSAAKKQLNKGIAAVKEGTQQQIGAYQTYGNQAQGYVAPYRESGERFNRLYGDAYGVNGVDARRGAQDLYLSDDILMRDREQRLKRQGAFDNAHGDYAGQFEDRSGTGALAAARVRQGAYGDWLRGLERGAGQGQNAATTSAGLAQQTGGQIGGAYGNQSGQLANLYGQQAANANTLAQNVISGVAVGTNLYGAYNGINNLSGAFKPGSK